MPKGNATVVVEEVKPPVALTEAFKSATETADTGKQGETVPTSLLKINPGRMAEAEEKFLSVMVKIRKVVGDTTRTLIADAVEYLSVVCMEAQRLGEKFLNDHVSELLAQELTDGDEREVTRMTWQGRTTFTKVAAPAMSRQLAQVYRRLALAQALIFDPDTDIGPGSEITEFGPQPDDKLSPEARAAAMERLAEREKVVMADEPEVAAVVRWKREGIVHVKDRTGEGDYKFPVDALRDGRSLQATFTAWQKVTRPKVLILESLEDKLERASFEAADGTSVVLRAEVEDKTTHKKRMGQVKVPVKGRREAVSGYIQGLLVAAIGEGSMKLHEVPDLFKVVQAKVEANYAPEDQKKPEGEV